MPSSPRAPDRLIAMKTLLILLASTALLEAGPVGFASLGGGTTGGGESKVIEVHNAKELQSAAERLDLPKDQRNREPRVIRLAGDIHLGELGNVKPGHDLKRIGIIEPCSDTTIEGPPGGATLSGGTIELKEVSNVIIRNLRFRGLWEHDPSGEYDEMGWDYVRITYGARRVWVDHCDFGKVYDGPLDIVQGADLVTLSHCIFSGGDEEQKKGILIGNSSSEKTKQRDAGHLNVTIHGCIFRGLGSRAPRLRTGNVHLFNNLVEDVGSATISVSGGATLAEGCVYRDCKTPTTFSHADDSVEKGRGGSIRIVDCQDSGKGSGDRLKNQPEEGFRFNKPEGIAWEDLAKIPYPYTRIPAAEVEAMVKREAGPK